MNSYTRYVLRQLFLGVLLVTAGLTCIVWLSQSLRFVEMIVNRGLGATTFIYMTMLLLPNFLTVLLPLSLFFVVTFVYSKMITDRELVVMRAAGVSQFGLAKPALIVSGIVLIFGYILNLYLLPESYRSFRVLQWEIRNTYSHVLLKEGAFNSISGSVTAYVRERTPDGQLLGILLHDKREENAPVTWMASRGALVESNDGARVVLYNGNRQALDENGKLSILYFDRNVFDIESQRENRADRFREPRERSIGELINLQKDSVSARDWGKYKVELHKRLVSPLVGLGFTLVALGSLLYGPITRRSQTVRIIIAVAIMVTLQGGFLGLENVIAKNLSLTPLLYLLSALPIMAGIFALIAHPKTSRSTRKSNRTKMSEAT